MAEPKAAPVLDADGPGAPPRHNGELVFEAPWESRIFGLTMAMFSDGYFEWDEFRRRLIEEIARAEQAPPALSYYACWQAAFERLVADKGLCEGGELSRRVAELADRPHGHDH